MPCSGEGSEGSIYPRSTPLQVLHHHGETVPASYCVIFPAQSHMQLTWGKGERSGQTRSLPIHKIVRSVDKSAARVFSEHTWCTRCASSKGCPYGDVPTPERKPTSSNFAKLDEVVDLLHWRKNLVPQCLAVLGRKFRHTEGLEHGERKNRAQDAMTIINTSYISRDAAYLVPQPMAKKGKKDKKGATLTDTLTIPSMSIKQSKQLLTPDEEGTTLLARFANILFSDLPEWYLAQKFVQNFSDVCWSMLDENSAADTYARWCCYNNDSSDLSMDFYELVEEVDERVAREGKSLGVSYDFPGQVTDLRESAEAFGVSELLEKFIYWHLLTHHMPQERIMLFELGLDFRMAWMEAMEANNSLWKATNAHAPWRMSTGKEARIRASLGEIAPILAGSTGKDLEATAKGLGVASSYSKFKVATYIGNARAFHNRREVDHGATSTNTAIAGLSDPLANRAAQADMGKVRKAKEFGRLSDDEVRARRQQLTVQKMENSKKRKAGRQMFMARRKKKNFYS